MKPSVIMAVAVVALVLGGIGLYYGVTAKDAQATLGARVASVEQKADSTANDVSQADGKIRTLRDQVQNALTSVNSDLVSMHQEIGELTNKAVQARGPAKEGKEGEGKKGEKGEKAKKGEKAAKPANGMYTLKAGDTVAKIAKEFGVTKRAIMEANPTLEEDKIKAGRKIRIP